MRGTDDNNDSETEYDEDSGPQAPGTAGEARIVKAGCGIRFEEDQLSDGIAFDGVKALKPTVPEDDA
ncbi:hypothetical protein [Marinobacter sp. BGYM27]|uniref:hypothetical protein n=1 Tax=Marinobacter sp. BGYM27 TaxID=2975597 RepID=UPI0021A3B67F|nr:hypothetical protein [Marinobacter sp. BGYM27]MDG5499451.1 hypothetical protein [Marinobacter sp. BGYM27]